MKRIFVILLTFVLLLGICPMSALAETGGSGNVDGGGGDMGQGTSQNSWNPGMDGVRITVVDAESGQPVSSSFDLTNKTPSIKIHFGKVSKIQYANGASISPTTGNYDYYTPATPMPRIVSSGNVVLDGAAALIGDPAKALQIDGILVWMVCGLPWLTQNPVSLCRPLLI